MGDLGKLKIALGQPELVQGRPSANEAAIDRAIDRALDLGADAVVLPGSLEDEDDVRIIGLNDTRIDVAGSNVVLDACGETYRIAVGHHADSDSCDIRVVSNLEPFAIDGRKPAESGACPAIVVSPVGIADFGTCIACFEGGSGAYSASGALVSGLRADFREDAALASFDDSTIDRRAAETNVLDALVSGIQRFDALALPWKPRWVIGLSGGLDSTVVAALLALALGSERVIGYNLATRFNSLATKSNAANVAKALGITLRSGSIEGQVTELGATIEQFGYDAALLRGLALENAQARARGNLLSTFSALEGGVVANNGNRIESALGYATLYGDSIGALAPIADLSKVQLFDVARAVNDRLGVEAVPANLLPVETETGYTWETMPSAELSDGQRDPMKWFYHDWLVGVLLGDANLGRTTRDEAACEVMRRYSNDKLESCGMGKWVRYYGLDDSRAFVDDLDWVLKNMRASAFKRIQAPPKIALTRTSVTNEGREPQVAPEWSHEFNVLRARLLASSR